MLNYFIRSIKRFAAPKWLLGIVALSLPGDGLASDGNRLAYLDEFCNPYYAGLTTPKLTTPQWVGEKGVDAVITLGIDDMRDPDHYEGYLRPILNRLREIDGRAPVSVMTNSVDPQHPILQAWLKEGLSLETHTADHPCPCLRYGRFKQAKDTYDQCVDQLAAVPNSHPVAFRFPCMDSLNTPSPRAFAEIINKLTPAGNFLQISTSVCNVHTAGDPALSPETVTDKQGQPRFSKYLPFASFVNKIEDYPYPFVIGRLCWEFPCAVPDDWQGQHLHGSYNPQTVEDYKAAIDAAVVKQGVANFIFHPYLWIRNEQLVDVIDYAATKFGSRVKFLNFRECLERINKYLLAGEPLRSSNGQDNGVRLLDLNGDGYLDVVIGNDRVRKTRIWLPEEGTWLEGGFPAGIVSAEKNGRRLDSGVRFGILGKDGNASALVANEQGVAIWHLDGADWLRDQDMEQGLEIDGTPLLAARNGVDQGVRFRDVDGDGTCELIVSNPSQHAVLRWDEKRELWRPDANGFPMKVLIVDGAGRDAGLRFADLDEDGHDDIVFSNERRYAVHRYDQALKGWAPAARSGARSDAAPVPMIVRDGSNNGAWFADRHMWVQNEDTSRLPDGVDRRAFAELLDEEQPPPLSAVEGLRSLKLRSGFEAQLVAAEPLVMDPVSFDWGPDGRLWVVEMADYPLGLDDRGQPGGRVRYLEDINGDGIYDRSTLFAEGLHFPTGIMAWRGGVLVSAAPEILYLEDSDGDGRSDLREVLFHGFGEGNQQHRANGFAAGLDNWLYVANGDSGGVIVSGKTGKKVDISGRDLRLKPDTGELDAQTGQSQFGRYRDDWDNWFGSDNSTPLRHFVLADHYLRRNTHFAPPAPANNIARSDNTEIYPRSRVLSHWEGYQPPAAGQPHRFTSACGGTFYRDELFGPHFKRSMFICEPVHNLVHRRVVEPAGTTFTSRRAEDEQTCEFLSSNDSWFRPACVRTGPDGALWLADMYRLVIEHPQWIDDEEEKRLFLRAGHDKGRIYRIFPSDQRPRTFPRLSSMDAEQLVAALDSPNGWQRDTAQRLLIQRNDRAVIPLLISLLTSGKRPLARLHALCTLDGLEALNEQLLLVGLRDGHPAVQRHTIRLCEPLLPSSPLLQDELVKLVDGDDPQRQLQLAYTLGAWDDAKAGRALAQLALNRVDDEYIRAAILSSLRSAALAAAAPLIFSAHHDGDAYRNFVRQLLVLAAVTGEVELLAEAFETTLFSPREGGARAFHFTTLAEVHDALQRSGLGFDAVPSDTARARISDLIEDARHTALSAESELEARIAALQLLIRDEQGHEADRQVLFQLIYTQQPIELQSAALVALGRSADDSAVPLLLDTWQKHSLQVRSGIVELLLKRQPWTDALLSQIEAGVVAANEIDPVYRGRLLTEGTQSSRSRAETAFGGSIETDRQGIVDQYQRALSLPGNPESGQLLFAKHCAGCHHVHEVGHEVGPDLSALRDKSPVAILTAVLDPSRAVEDKYRTYVALSADGLAYSGILASQTATSVTLKGQAGKDQVLLRSDLESVESTESSLMPDGLESELNISEMADLLAYVTTLGQPRMSAEGD